MDFDPEGKGFRLIVETQNCATSRHPQKLTSPSLAGVLLVTFLSTAMEWFPRNRGLAAGVSALGSGFSGFIFASIQSAFINPWNYVPDDAPYAVS